MWAQLDEITRQRVLDLDTSRLPAQLDQLSSGCDDALALLADYVLANEGYTRPAQLAQFLSSHAFASQPRDLIRPFWVGEGTPWSEELFEDLTSLRTECETAEPDHDVSASADASDSADPYPQKAAADPLEARPVEVGRLVRRMHDEAIEAMRPWYVAFLDEVKRIQRWEARRGFIRNDASTVGVQVGLRGEQLRAYVEEQRVPGLSDESVEAFLQRSEEPRVLWADQQKLLRQIGRRSAVSVDFELVAAGVDRDFCDRASAAHLSAAEDGEYLKFVLTNGDEDDDADDLLLIATSTQDDWGAFPPAYVRAARGRWEGYVEKGSDTVRVHGLHQYGGDSRESFLRAFPRVSSREVSFAVRASVAGPWLIPARELATSAGDRLRTLQALTVEYGEAAPAETTAADGQARQAHQHLSTLVEQPDADIAGICKTAVRLATAFDDVVELWTTVLDHERARLRSHTNRLTAPQLSACLTWLEQIQGGALEILDQTLQLVSERPDDDPRPFDPTPLTSARDRLIAIADWLNTLKDALWQGSDPEPQAFPRRPIESLTPRNALVEGHPLDLDLDDVRIEIWHEVMARIPDLRAKSELVVPPMHRIGSRGDVLHTSWEGLPEAISRVGKRFTEINGQGELSALQQLHGDLAAALAPRLSRTTDHFIAAGPPRLPWKQKARDKADEAVVTLCRATVEFHDVLRQAIEQLGGSLGEMSDVVAGDWQRIREWSQPAGNPDKVSDSADADDSSDTDDGSDGEEDSDGTTSGETLTPEELLEEIRRDNLLTLRQGKSAPLRYRLGTMAGMDSPTIIAGDHHQDIAFGFDHVGRIEVITAARRSMWRILANRIRRRPVPGKIKVFSVPTEAFAAVQLQLGPEQPGPWEVECFDIP